MKQLIAALVVIVAASTAACDAVPDTSPELDRRIESKFGFKVGSSGGANGLYLLQLEDSEAFKLPEAKKRELTHAIASEIEKAYRGKVHGIAVAIAEDSPRRGVAWNFLYVIRDGVIRLEQVAGPVAGA